MFQGIHGTICRRVARLVHCQADNELWQVVLAGRERLCDDRGHVCPVHLSRARFGLAAVVIAFADAPTCVRIRRALRLAVAQVALISSEHRGAVYSYVACPCVSVLFGQKAH